jgi:predicted transport protein
MEQSIVGKLIYFRGLVYSPINEQGVVFLFGRILEDLNLYIEEIRIKYPDCVARRYTGKGWERVYIEFEYKSSNFILHGHDPNECNMIVCWEDDLNEVDRKKLAGIEIIELRVLIDELENNPIEEPDKVSSKSEYDLPYHFDRIGVNKNIQKLYKKLDSEIKSINEQVFRKFAKTAITYYSPERTFVSLRFQKSVIAMDIYTNQQKISGVKLIPNHENWGTIRVKNEEDLARALAAIKISFVLIRKAIENNINTGWYAVTPKEKMTWLKAEKDEDDNED